MLPEPEVPGRWKAFLIACGSPAEDTFNEKAVWETWEQVVPFLRGELYEVGDETRFKTAINKFTKAFIACWGEGHVTHYMHILHAHGPWLIKTHGSLLATTWSVAMSRDGEIPLGRSRKLAKTHQPRWG